MCAAASVVIDSTRFCHGFAGNLRRNMEALNFSQPTRRHNGKAGGEGRGKGIITCTRSRRAAGAATWWLCCICAEAGTRGGKKNSSHFGSVSRQVSDGKCDYFSPTWICTSRSPNRMLFWVIWFSESVTQSLLQFLRANKLRPLPVHTDSDLLELPIWKKRNDPSHREIVTGETFLPLFLFTGVPRYFQLTNWRKRGRVSEPLNRDEVPWLTSQ